VSPAQVRRILKQGAQKYPHLREVAGRLQKEHFEALLSGASPQEEDISCLPIERGIRYLSNQDTFLTVFVT
jgi:hypothetical protein